MVFFDEIKYIHNIILSLVWVLKNNVYLVILELNKNSRLYLPGEIEDCPPQSTMYSGVRMRAVHPSPSLEVTDFRSDSRPLERCGR